MQLDEKSLDVLFRNARSQNAWKSEAVSDELLQELYALLRMGPTSANSSPARFLFLKSESAKKELATLVSAGNVEKVVSAPVVAIIAYDLKFHEFMPKLFAHSPGMQSTYAGNASLAESTAFRNSSLQGAYLMMAARSLGLDCGPMSGFDNAAVDSHFFDGTTHKSNFLCGLGYGDESKLFDRLPRLDFDEACEIR